MKKSLISKVLYALAALLILFYCVKEARGNGDFKIFLEASKMLRDGGNPYHVWHFVSEGNYGMYFYSPLWALVLIPFTYFPSFVPNFIWLLANVFFLYRLFQLLKQYIDFNLLSKKQQNWLIILCLIMSFRFILYNFGMIQMTLFILWGILESLRFIRNKQVFWGALILALIINIKVLPLVILPYLIFRRQFKAFAGTILISGLLLWLPSIYTGWSQNQFLLTEWWSVINPTNADHVLETEMGQHSLSALISTLLTENTEPIKVTRNIVNWSETRVSYVLNLLRLFLIFLSLYFLKWPPFKSAKNKLTELRELAYIILLIPLIFPHQQKYAFALIIPALFYLNYYFLKLKGKPKNKIRWYAFISCMIISFLLMTASTDGLIGRDLNKLSQHFKTITWGALFLIGALLLANPRNIKNKCMNRKEGKQP